ncbi:unnamed protein product [Amoebophrya sp. A25]|nr:unnamed protein product [Amoebophrya sp. A25]|eukprot:GSA25T00018020001.1
MIFKVSRRVSKKRAQVDGEQSKPSARTRTSASMSALVEAKKTSPEDIGKWRKLKSRLKRWTKAVESMKMKLWQRKDYSYSIFTTSLSSNELANIRTGPNH